MQITIDLSSMWIVGTAIALLVAVLIMATMRAIDRQMIRMTQNANRAVERIAGSIDNATQNLAEIRGAGMRLQQAVQSASWLNTLSTMGHALYTVHMPMLCNAILPNECNNNGYNNDGSSGHATASVVAAASPVVAAAAAVPASPGFAQTFCAAFFEAGHRAMVPFLSSQQLDYVNRVVGPIVPAAAVASSSPPPPIGSSPSPASVAVVHPMVHPVVPVVAPVATPMAVPAGTGCDCGSVVSPPPPAAAAGMHAVASVAAAPVPVVSSAAVVAPVVRGRG